ncbi:MAG TPA: hypothetical protein VF904_17900 [Anaeromyxobacteraceae bacterium]
MMGRRSFASAALGIVLAAAVPVPAAAAGSIPVRVRIIKGSRQGPAAVDPKLADLHGQLGRLAYQRWDQVGEHQKEMELGKSASLPLPDGSTLDLTLVDARKDTVTFEVKVPARKTHSRLTISKDQRIVHQVTDEKSGEAFFATVRPWP